jgi:hypothetical protein
MQKLPHERTVIAATDNNPGGVNLARKIREIAEEAARQDLCMVDTGRIPKARIGMTCSALPRRSRSPARHRPGQPADPRPTWNPDNTLRDNDQSVRAV